MIKGALPRPGTGRGIGRPKAIRKPRWQRGQSPPFCWFYRFFYRYAIAGFALAALGLIWIMGVVGCGPALTSGYMGSSSTTFSHVRQSPLEVARHLRNAHYYKLMGRPDLALKELENAHRQNPDNLKIVNTLAQDYEAQGHFEAARKIYGESLTRNGHNRALANNLCFTYYLEGRWQEAEACFRQTLARDPGNEAARNNLGLLYCRLGRQDEARQLWQEAEGSTAATAKLHQALAALGLGDGPIYAQAPKPAAPDVAETSTSRPVAAAPTPPVSPVKSYTTAKPVAPRNVGMRLTAKAKPESPAPKSVKPLTRATPPLAPHKSTATPAPAPPPVQLAASPLRPPYLTCAELVDTGIEVRNGTPRPHFAQEMRSLFSQEALTVVRIGNHIDFGAKKTKIYYRPEAQRVARILRKDILPMAGLEQTVRLNGRTDIKVLLGHDLLEDQTFMARLTGKEFRPAVAVKAPVQREKSLAGATEAKKTTIVAETSHTAPQEKAAPPPSWESRAQSTHPFQPLTAPELEHTAIEIRNGNGSPHLAHETRTLLGLEGFNVAVIGNHIDFGAKKTIIYFRPEGERVAQALSRTFFPKAELEPSLKLHNKIAVKILLGADLLRHPQLMARLNLEGQ